MYPKLHNRRGYFNDRVKANCYKRGRLRDEVSSAPTLPKEMFTVAPPPLEEKTEEEAILELAMSVKRTSTELVTALRRGWEYPHVKKMKAKDVDLELTSIVESVSDNLGTIKTLPIKEKKQVLSLLIKAKELYTPKRGTEVERRGEEAPVEAPVQESPVQESPAQETPVQETPAQETPAQEPGVEEVPVEAPAVPSVLE